MDLFVFNEAEFGYNGKAVTPRLSFAVERGAYLCLTGANGTGKSTVLKGILGLLAPMKGTIQLATDLQAKNTGYLAQQEAARKDFPAAVLEVVLSGFAGRLGLRPFFSKEERKQADKILERLGLSSLRASCFRELSGGQQRRVLLARALCAARTLLVLDEPCAGLDSEATRGLYDLLAKRHHEDGLTVIMATHAASEALKHADFSLKLSAEGFSFGKIDKSKGEKLC